jgi:hypothetical protein
MDWTQRIEWDTFGLAGIKNGEVNEHTLSL